MNILITGANSILSQELIKILGRGGNHTIYALYNINTDNLAETAEYLDIGQLRKLDIDMDVVFHVASLIPYGNWDRVSKELVDTNVRLLLEMIRLYEDSRFIFCSSVSVYGSNQAVIREDSPLCPENAYAVSKLAGELLVRSLESYAILRLSSIYGKGIKTPTFIPRAIQQARDDGVIIVFGDGSREQNYIHVADAARFLYQAMLCNENHSFLAVGEQSRSNREVAAIISGIIPDSRVEFVGEENPYSVDYENSFSLDKLQIQYAVSLEDGIQEMIHGS